MLILFKEICLSEISLAPTFKHLLSPKENQTRMTMSIKQESTYSSPTSILSQGPQIALVK